MVFETTSQRLIRRFFLSSIDVDVRCKAEVDANVGADTRTIDIAPIIYNTRRSATTTLTRSTGKIIEQLEAKQEGFETYEVLI